MKLFLTIALTSLMTLSVSAQNKNAKHELHVKGNCGECKERIEKAAYSAKGVKTAQWDTDTETLKIILNETKGSVEGVEDAIVAVGHDTNDKKAAEKVYSVLPSCCLYDRESDPNDPEKAATRALHKH